MARLGFFGACPTETETSRREAGFHRVFPHTNQSVWIVLCCTMVAEVPYGMHTPKEERAVILRDPRLFTSPPMRGFSLGGLGRHADYGSSGTIEGRQSQSPRQERASKRAAQRQPPQHHTATGIQGHQASPAGSRAVPSPTNTGAVDTRPKQPPGTAHPHRERTSSPTGSPQPQTPPSARTGSTAGSQPGGSNTGPPGAPPPPWHT